ncbi:hypothetical protein ACFY36_15125 [Actinoplanes sp. NPDC000266]
MLNPAAALAEFTALRAEILARQGHQHTFLALNLTISGTVFGFALAQPSRLLVLLVVPYVAFMTCGKYIAHDYAAQAIGTYIRQQLSDRVIGGLGWEEHFSRTHVVPGRRLFFGIDPLFVGFPGIAAAALVFCSPPMVRSLMPASPQGMLLAVLWLLGFVLTCLSFRNLWLTRKIFVLSEWRRNGTGRRAKRLVKAAEPPQ